MINKKHIATFILLGITICATASLILPGPRKFVSVDRKFSLYVIPPEQDTWAPGLCRGDFYAVNGTNQIKVWTRYFPNNGAPSHVFISTNGEFIVTLLDWADRGINLPIIIYSGNRMKHAFTSSELNVEHNGNSSYLWGDKTKAFFVYNEKYFVVLPELGSPIIITQDGEFVQVKRLADEEKTLLLETIKAEGKTSRTLVELIGMQEPIIPWPK